MWSQRGIAQLLQLFEIPSVLVIAVVDDKDEHLTLKLLANNCWSVKSVIFLTLNEPTNHQQKFAKAIVEKKKKESLVYIKQLFPQWDQQKYTKPHNSYLGQFFASHVYLVHFFPNYCEQKQSEYICTTLSSLGFWLCEETNENEISTNKNIEPQHRYLHFLFWLKNILRVDSKPCLASWP